MVSEGRVVIIGVIPKALGGNSDTLAGNLPNDSLHDDLVGRNGQLFGLLLNLAHDCLNLGLGLSLVILLVGNVSLNHLLNNLLYFIWIIPIYISR